MKELRNRTKQSPRWVKEVLGDIAVLHTSGDWANMYELKDHLQDSNVDGVAPNTVDDSDMDKSGLDDEDDDEDADFENVQLGGP
jgi:transcription initiation factor TFIIF subunit beta